MLSDVRLASGTWVVEAGGGVGGGGGDSYTTCRYASSETCHRARLAARRSRDPRVNARLTCDRVARRDDTSLSVCLPGRCTTSMQKINIQSHPLG